MRLLENSKIEINIEKCTKCKECVKDCVADLYYFEQDQLHVVDSFEERCIECGHCEAVCPVNVIRLKFHDEDELERISIREEVPKFNRFLNLVLKRRSIRQFKDKPIPKDLINKLLEVGRYSPTGGNNQNIFYTVVQDKNVVNSISEHITNRLTKLVNTVEAPKGRDPLNKSKSEDDDTLANIDLPKIKRKLEMIKKGIDFWCWNGELLIIHGEETAGGIPSNSALAAANIMLAAEILGVGTCSLGYLTHFINASQTIRELIKIPSDNVVGYTLTMGYPDVKYKRIPARKPLSVQWL
ncbi:MAG: nitroreductase family protein [Promethearchaeota archaeon]|jgi:nitroreductase/NAD-dependent dihydropyrimidine dehydrogenase PreA subunit